MDSPLVLTVRASDDPAEKSNYRPVWGEKQALISGLQYGQPIMLAGVGLFRVGEVRVSDIRGRRGRRGRGAAGRASFCSFQFDWLLVVFGQIASLNLVGTHTHTHTHTHKGAISWILGSIGET